MIGIIWIGLVFCPIAAAMAFLITYEEDSRHGFARRRVIGRSLASAIVTFALFAVLAIVLGLLLPRIVGISSPVVGASYL
jgi:predicted PurR-regulated permease PerM